jgi:hypothetical protein
VIRQSDMEPDGELELLLNAAQRREQGAGEALRMSLAADVRSVIEACLPLNDATRLIDDAEDYVWSVFDRKLAGLTPYRGRIAAYVRVLVTDFEAWRLTEAARHGDQAAFSRLVKLFEKMVQGAISTKLRNDRQAVQEIANDVFLKLHQKLQDLEPASGLISGWLSTVARNKAIDYLRSRAGKKEEGPRPTPQQLFDQLLDLVAKDSLPAHFVIVYGLHRFMNLNAQGIVDQFAELPLGALEENLRSHWPKAQSIPLPDCATPLKRFLPSAAPADAVARWIKSAQTLAEETLQLAWIRDPAMPAVSPGKEPVGLPPQVFEKLLHLTFSGINLPHQAIAFGFNKLLVESPEIKYTPQEIDRHLGERPLHLLEVRLETEYAAEASLNSQSVDEIFAALRVDAAPNTGVGESNLRSYQSPSGLPRDIPRWAQNVRRRTIAEVLRNETDALKLVFEGNEPPHQLLAFAFTRLLGWQPAELKRQGESRLHALAATLEEEYGRKTDLGSAAFSGCLQKLRQRLDRAQPGDTFLPGQALLRQYFEGDGALDIAQWRDLVQDRVYKQLHSGGKELVFWYICGYLN